MNKIKILFICLTIFFLTANRIRAKKRKAPDFDLFDIDKKVHRLSRIIETNIVVLNFFGTWCPPCRMEIPDFVKVSKEYESKGVQFIGILCERQYIDEKIKKFIKTYKIKYPVLMATHEVLKDYQIRAYPTTFIIDKKGYIIKKHLGLLLEKDLKEIIERYIKLRDIEQKKAGTTRAATNNNNNEK